LVFAIVRPGRAQGFDRALRLAAPGRSCPLQTGRLSSIVRVKRGEQHAWKDPGRRVFVGGFHGAAHGENYSRSRVVRLTQRLPPYAGRGCCRSHHSGSLHEIGGYPARLPQDRTVNNRHVTNAPLPGIDSAELELSAYSGIYLSAR